MIFVLTMLTVVSLRSMLAETRISFLRLRISTVSVFTPMFCTVRGSIFTAPLRLRLHPRIPAPDPCRRAFFRDEARYARGSWHRDSKGFYGPLRLSRLIGVARRSPEQASYRKSGNCRFVGEVIRMHGTMIDLLLRCTAFRFGAFDKR